MKINSSDTPPGKSRDEELVRLARGGDNDAQEELLHKYKKIVRKKAASYYMAGADRDDVIQEGMIGVFKAIRDYDEEKGATFATFAELCVNRQITSAVRAASRNKHSPLNNSMSLQNPLSAADGENTTLEDVIAQNTIEDPQAMLLLREDLDYIGKNGDTLFSPLEKQVWKLYMQGASYAEISRATGKSFKTIDNALFRAKKKVEPYIR